MYAFLVQKSGCFGRELQGLEVIEERIFLGFVLKLHSVSVLRKPGKYILENIIKSTRILNDLTLSATALALSKFKTLILTSEMNYAVGIIEGTSKAIVYCQEGPSDGEVESFISSRRCFQVFHPTRKRYTILNTNSVRKKGNKRKSFLKKQLWNRCSNKRWHYSVKLSESKEFLLRASPNWDDLQTKIQRDSAD